MLKKTVLISTILVASSGAQALSSASFTVAGTVNPPSCTLKLNGGVTNIDFGTMTAADARKLPTFGAAATPHYTMPTKTVDWNVDCTAPMPFELVLEDNNAGKVYPLDTNNASRHGLVNASAVTVGSITWAMSSTSLAATTADGASVYGFFSALKGSTAWGTPATSINFLVPGKAFALAKLSTSTSPLWVTKAQGKLEVTPYVNKGSVDVATSSIGFSGSAKFTLQYL